MIDMQREEVALFTEVVMNLDDDGARGIYADWLEERGDPRAEILRLEDELLQTDRDSDEFVAIQKRLRTLRRGVSKEWIEAITRPAIEKCTHNDPHSCPQRWDRLSLTQFSRLRQCWVCHHQVYYCRTMSEARSQGGRVAVSVTLAREPGDLKGRK